MVGILVISHGSLAAGLKDAAEMIMGQQGQFQAVGLQPQQSPEEFQEIIRAEVKGLDCGEGVLILADLFGGSPANAAAYLVSDKLNVEVVTGVSLPMLLEALTARMGQDLPAVADTCIAAVSQGVRKFSEIFS
ncbi:MAG: PTS sugar transporter subunit IIA [Firmicutes bacterium]|nr:PTS sugar transporter subunit IIA [Bacillota bacterium]